jgi:hypothetical protein
LCLNIPVFKGRILPILKNKYILFYFIFSFFFFWGGHLRTLILKVWYYFIIIEFLTYWKQVLKTCCHLMINLSFRMLANDITLENWKNISLPKRGGFLSSFLYFVISRICLVKFKLIKFTLENWFSPQKNFNKIRNFSQMYTRKN